MLTPATGSSKYMIGMIDAFSHEAVADRARPGRGRRTPQRRGLRSPRGNTARRCTSFTPREQKLSGIARLVALSTRGAVHIIGSQHSECSLGEAKLWV